MQKVVKVKASKNRRAHTRKINSRSAYSIPYDTKITGSYKVVGAGVDDVVKIAGHEKATDKHQDLYQSDLGRINSLGSLRVSNSLISKLSKGKCVVANTTTGFKVKVTKLEK